MPTTQEPSLADFLAAQVALRDVMDPTPLAPVASLSRAYGLDLLAKHENLTPTRSFKVRGAALRLLSLDDSRGVVTATMGNHGWAVAYVAARMGLRAVVVFPEAASRVKVEHTRGLGAEIRVAGETYTDATDEAKRIAAAEDLELINDGGDLELMVGAGTTAVEILHERPDTDVILVPTGGGNLLAGVATCAKALKPSVQVVSVQAEGAAAVYESWKAKSSVHITANTIADGLKGDEPGPLTFPYILRHVDDFALVTDDEILAAMVVALEEIGQVVEPAGAASLAAAKKYRERWPSKTVAAILTGGNADAETIRMSLEA